MTCKGHALRIVLILIPSPPPPPHGFPVTRSGRRPSYTVTSKGSLVSWYHVMLRPSGEHVLSKWQAVGMAEAPAPKRGVSVYDTERGVVKLRVEQLVPGVSYQFRVCAQNGVG